MKEPFIFELSMEGHLGYSLPDLDVPEREIEEVMPSDFLRQNAPILPEAAEGDVVRHFTRLSRLNYGVDNGFYPLGSCTMKYNPKINEKTSNLPGFTRLHPLQPEELCQGALQLVYELEQYLAEIGGMDAVSIQPAAGAQGELAGLLMIKAYHQDKGESRKTMLVPDSAHGTNPATAALCGFRVQEVKSNARGGVDLEELKSLVSEDTAGLMLTNPNTLGLFEEEIEEIAEIIHQAGGLLYYDGANLNAIMGITRPGDMGFDVVHFNLHKTFSTPHGGGGPGSGPVGVKKILEPFLSKPIIKKKDDYYYFDYNRPQSIGKVKAFYGNFAIVVRAYTYILALGFQGLRKVSENAVLNANYLMQKLKEHYYLPYDQLCKHEFVVNDKYLKDVGVSTLDVAKRLLDFGYHPPTIYFPLIVPGALMIEPTETENKNTLDEFINVLIDIFKEGKENPELLKEAPHTSYVSRMDEVRAARNPVVRWQKEV